jgi:hypothetical protein
MLDYGAIYSQMHRKRKHFTGRSIFSGLPLIVELVKQTQPRRILDYGCGKGIQYSEHCVHDGWGGLMPVLYDVGVKEFAQKPTGAFDGLICTDVMEHIDPPDVNAILSDIFSYLPPRDDGGESFAFFWISCRPAKRKTLPDGRGVHLTVRHGDWWDEVIDSLAPHHVNVVARYETDDVK